MTGIATSQLGADDRAIASLREGRDKQARFTTATTVDGDDTPGAASAEFAWVVRLAPAG